MSTTTSKVKLRMPDRIDGVNVALDLDGNMDIIDANIEFFDCTSTTRPSAPFNGMLIFEHDTGNMLIYSKVNVSDTSRQWIIIGNGNYPYNSAIGYASVTANSGVRGSGTEFFDLTITFTAVAGRRYLVEGIFSAGNDGGGTGQHLSARMRYKAGATVDNTGTLIGAAIPIDVVPLQNTFTCFGEFLPAAGQTTVGISIAGGANWHFVASATEPSHIYLRDWGV